MASRDLNTCIIHFRLGADPEFRATNAGGRVANLRVATNDVKKVGETWETKASWMNVTVLTPSLVDLTERFLKKGSGFTMVGRAQTSEWEKDGQKHSRVEFIANEILLDPKSGEGGGSEGAAPVRATAGAARAAAPAAAARPAGKRQPALQTDEEDEDIPF